MIKFKKYLSVLLATIMVVSTNTAAFAAGTSGNEPNSGSGILICEDSEGIYKIVNSDDNKAKSRSAVETLKVFPELQFDNIYSTASQNQYYQKVNDEELIQVSKVEFDLSDYNAYTDIQKYSIPDEVLEGIASMAALAEKTDSKDAQGVIFVAENNTRASDLNTYPMKTTTWNGQTFHHYQVYFTDMWTSWQTISEKSATTKAVLSAIKEIVVSGAGMVSAPIGVASSIYAGGKSCLEAFQTATGKTPIYGNTNNKVMVDVNYDIYLKYTYFYDKGLKEDRLGCSSQKVYLKRVDTDSYFYTSTGGARDEKTVYPKKTYKTPNYDNPESIAYDHYISGWVETAKGTVYKKTIKFSFPNFTWPSNWP